MTSLDPLFVWPRNVPLLSPATAVQLNESMAMHRALSEPVVPNWRVQVCLPSGRSLPMKTLLAIGAHVGVAAALVGLAEEGALGVTGDSDAVGRVNGDSPGAIRVARTELAGPGVLAVGAELAEEGVQALGSVAAVEVAACLSQIGSGAQPAELLSSAGLTMTPLVTRGSGKKLASIASAFRNLPVPVIGRIEDGVFMLDLRCLEDESSFIQQLTQLQIAGAKL